MRERLALVAMHLIGCHFLRGDEPWTLHLLTHRLGIPMHSVTVVLDALLRAGLLRRTNDRPRGYVPGRDLSQVPVAEVFRAIRSAGEDAYVNPAALPLPGAVGGVLDAVEEAIDSALADLSAYRLADGPEDVGGDWRQH